jgi:hypothetical protein
MDVITLQAHVLVIIGLKDEALGIFTNYVGISTELTVNR